MTAYLRHSPIFLLSFLMGFLVSLTSFRAQAAPCADALNRFDYPAARAVAQGQLHRNPDELPPGSAWRAATTKPGISPTPSWP